MIVSNREIAGQFSNSVDFVLSLKSVIGHVTVNANVAAD